MCLRLCKIVLIVSLLAMQAMAGNVVFSDGTSVYTAADGTNILPFATQTYVADQLESASQLTLHGATNANPIIPSACSLYGTTMSPWEFSTNLAVGTNFCGAYWYTTRVDRIRHDNYIGRFYANKSGNGDVSGFMKIVYSDDDGATTNVIDTSNNGGLITSLGVYRLFAFNPADINSATTNLMLGVLFYGVCEKHETVLTIYGGSDGTVYDTHLETPGIGVVGSSVHEANVDGNFYVRRNAAWSKSGLTTNQPVWTGIATNWFVITNGIVWSILEVEP